MPLLAYHGDVAVKDKYVRRVQAHRAADAIIQGTGWDGSKGCAVGCTLESYAHERYPIELGVPEMWAQLEDVIFEGLPKADALEWPTQFLEAIPVGVDLWPALHRFLARVQLEICLPAALAVEPQETAPGIEKAIRDVATLHQDTAAGKHLSPWKVFHDTFDAELAKRGIDRSAAESAAESAAWSAAWSAAESAAWSAAWSAAESAAWSAAESAAWSAARSAAESAAESAARSAAWSAAWRRMRDIALEELRASAPIEG